LGRRAHADDGLGGAHVTQAERDEFNHATPKPVGLFTIPIVKHLRAGEACYEPFAGSGPQFIAAEQHGVRCFGTELEPSFCQVIIDRWEAFTGQKAVKAGEAVRA
jgi:DNA modification methylase